MSVIDATASYATSLPGSKDINSGPMPELTRARTAGPLLGIYALLGGPGASLMRKLIRRLLATLEGGEMHSASLRQIMLKYHDVDIGAHSYGCFDAVRFPRGTRVGRYVSVGPGVEAYRRNHPLDRLSMHPYFYNPSCGATASADVATAELEIGADAWLGARAIILPGCRSIGRGAVVAAGAVVTKDVPDYAIVAGNPARVRRYRFSQEAIVAAESSLWWLDTPDTAAEKFDMTNDWSSACDVTRKQAIL